MSDELKSSDEIFRRLNTAEKEIYSMNKELIAIQQSRPGERLGLLEASVQQIKQDVVSMEQISADMSKKLGDGLDELKMQAAVSRAQVKWIVAGIGAGWAVLNSWPVLREILKATVS